MHPHPSNDRVVVIACEANPSEGEARSLKSPLESWNDHSMLIVTEQQVTLQMGKDQRRVEERDRLAGLLSHYASIHGGQANRPNHDNVAPFSGGGDGSTCSQHQPGGTEQFEQNGQGKEALSSDLAAIRESELADFEFPEEILNEAEVAIAQHYKLLMQRERIAARDAKEAVTQKLKSTQKKGLLEEYVQIENSAPTVEDASWATGRNNAIVHAPPHMHIPLAPGLPGPAELAELDLQLQQLAMEHMEMEVGDGDHLLQEVDPLSEDDDDYVMPAPHQMFTASFLVE